MLLGTALRNPPVVLRPRLIYISAYLTCGKPEVCIGSVSELRLYNFLHGELKNATSKKVKDSLQIFINPVSSMTAYTVNRLYPFSPNSLGQKDSANYKIQPYMRLTQRLF